MYRRPARVLRLAIAALVVAVLAIVLIFVLVGIADSNYGTGGRSFPFWVLGVIFVVFIVLFLARLVIWGVLGYPLYRFRRYWQYGPYTGERGAEQVLDGRYARGEINREQYQQMRDDIRRGGSGGSGP
jgi:putative membrane protein